MYWKLFSVESSTDKSTIPRCPISLKFFILDSFNCCISSTSIFQAIHDAKLEKKLEDLLLKLLKYNSTPNVQEPIRQFLVNYQIMSESFSDSYKNAHTYEEVLECYHQYAKNQCVIIETLLENLQFTLDKDDTRKELFVMLKDGFTF